MRILEDLTVQSEAVLGVSGRTKEMSFQDQLQVDKDHPRKVLFGDGQMTITYLDDDILILRDDGDPLVSLEGRVQNFYVKREVYLRSTGNATKLRHWRSYLDWRETLPQVPLWILSWLRDYGVSLSSKNPSYGEFNYIPKTSSICLSFEPDLLEKPVTLCQLGDLNDAGLIWSLFRYIFFEYGPGDGGVEMRASMYTNMLYSGIFWPASFIAAGAVLRAMKRQRRPGQLHVVELACGTALPSIVALERGAKVTSTDISLLSLRLAEQSAQKSTASARNDFSTMIFDIMEDSSQKLLDLHPDIIVESDLLYGEAIAKGLGHQLGVAASNGVTIITTDAGRMEGQGQRIFLEHFQNACSAGNVSSTSFSFLTEKIPDGILDLGLNAMKYGGQVDRAVGVFEFPPANSEKSDSVNP